MGAADDRKQAQSRPGPFEVEIVRDCAIPVGGAMLAADLHLPVVGRPAPALVTLVPYPKDGIAGIAAWAANRFFAAHGYATLLVDMRGTGASGGLPRPPFDPGDADDGAAVVQWAAEQPWCTGDVGMWGVSYGAFTALATAARGPGALKAIAAVMGFVDPERDFVHPSGRRGYLASLGMWSLSTLVQHVMPPLLDDRELQRRWRERVEQAEPFVLDLLRHGPGDPAWRTRAVDVSSIRVPTLCVAGWRDLFCEPTLRAYEAIEAPKELLVGPWMHTLPDESPDAPADFLALALGWWERWLQGRYDDSRAGSRATVYVQGRGEWRSLRTWPPSAARTLRLHAGTDGSLHEAPAEAGRIARPLDATVGAHGDWWGLPSRGFGRVRDQHEDDARSLAFTTEPLERPLEICGVPRAGVVANGADAIVVKLADVGPNGRSILITSGTRAEPSSEPLELIPTAYLVPAGHRLRLAVSGGDFPRLWPTAGTAGIEVECGSEAWLELPLADGSVGELADVPRPASRPSAVQSLVLRAEPLCTLTRDAITDGVTATVGEHLVMRTPHDQATMDMNWFTSATVAPDRPEGAHVTGKATIRADTANGDKVARAELLISADAAVVTAEVTIDGEPAFTRRWTL